MRSRNQAPTTAADTRLGRRGAVPTCSPRPELRVMDRRHGCGVSRAAAGACRHGLSGEPRFLMLGWRLRVKGYYTASFASTAFKHFSAACWMWKQAVSISSASSDIRALLRSLSAFRRRVVARSSGVFGIELDTVQDCLRRYMHRNLSPVLQFIGRVPEEVDGDSDTPKGRSGRP